MTVTAASNKQAAAIFDVDGTLCATRSTTSLVWLRACQHSIWRHRIWLASLLWRAPLAMAADRVSRHLADSMVYSQFAGLSLRQLQADAQRCCDEVLLPACHPDALAEMERHRKAGHRLILLSGGIDVVLRPLANALGAELLAQRLVAEDDRLTGAFRTYEVLDGTPGVANQRANKAQALRLYAEATQVDLAASCAYGDSVNDAGMLAAVGYPVAVNADRGLARIARARNWKVSRWRAKG